MAIEVKITTDAWYGDQDMTLSFPDNWDVFVCRSKDANAIDDLKIQEASKPINQLARNKKNAVIIVDDLSRPTPAHLVIPYIIRDLKEGGIKEESIQFVIGGGSHRPLNKEEIGKKLGQDVASKFMVHNHNVFSKTLENLGHLEDGTPVLINEIAYRSEFKIAIGGIIPHSSVGFGGGGKIILPGISGYDTISYNHSKFKSRGRGILEKQGNGKDIRDNAEDVARLVGLDFMVNMVLTKKREIAGLFNGDFIESYVKGAIFAKEIYDTPIPKEKLETADIVIINAYPQDYDPVQMSKSMWPAEIFKNAQKIVINPASDGIDYHGLSNKVDYETFLSMKSNELNSVIPKNGEVKSKDDFIMLSTNYPKGDFYKRYPKGALFEDWEVLINQLGKLYQKARVVIIPYSPIQLPRIVH
jgi:nickel-dependent lactate racemase